MSKHPRQQLWAIVVGAGALVQACAWVADLGPSKQRRPAGGAAAGASPQDGGIGQAGEAGASSAGASGAPNTDGGLVAHPAIGTLLGPGGELCTASLIGPRTALTAASCLPALGRGCGEPILDSEQFTFALALNPTRQFHVRAFVAFPAAFPLSAARECDGVCSLFEPTSIADVRRGRDLAIVYLSRDAEQRVPGDFVPPLRVLTEPEQALDASGASTYLDVSRDFRAGSVAAPLVVGFDAESAVPDRLQRDLVGRFDLGAFWNVGCEQTLACAADENRRNRCPALPFVSNGEFYQDNALRVLDVADQPWLSAFSHGSSGAALLLGHAPGTGSLSTLDTDTDTLLGVLSDTEPAAANRPGERSAAYFGVAFAPDVGGWLRRKIADFDSDCLPNEMDMSPTVPNAPSNCWDDLSVASGWSSKALERAIAAPTPRDLAWSPRADVAVTSPDGQRVALFVVAGDGTLYRTQAQADAQNSSTWTWTAWQRLLTNTDLRGELSAVPYDGDVMLFALTRENQLQALTVNPEGQVSEAAFPNLSGGVASAPSAVQVAFNEVANEVDLFVRGPGGELLRYKQRGGEWQPDVQTLIAHTTSAPSAVIRGASIELFVRGEDFHLLHWTISNDGSPGRFSSEDLGFMAGVPAAYSSGPDRLSVLSRDETGALLLRTRQTVGHWSDWLPVGVHLLTHPVPVALSTHEVFVFGFREVDNFQVLMHQE